MESREKAGWAVKIGLHGLRARAMESFGTRDFALPNPRSNELLPWELLLLLLLIQPRSSPFSTASLVNVGMGIRRKSYT